MHRRTPRFASGSPTARRRAAWVLGAALLGVAACTSPGDGDADPHGADSGAGRLETLLYNPRWYRTLDSSHRIAVDEGTLLFAWTFRDPLRHRDSFYIGIDTLWMLPQNVGGDTSVTGSWDLQICPDGFCQGGLASGINGFYSPSHFGGGGDFGDPDFETEHHFQFFPAIDTANNFRFTGPDSAIVGALLFVKPRSGNGPTDTVFGVGAWELPWDSAYPPPVRPVNGYRPKRTDFTIVEGMVRYIGP
jgi:hypothetical protein